ncbi:MAG: plastocyanin/azurin family copper-binding protein [Gemmatimonadales bacterium]
MPKADTRLWHLASGLTALLAATATGCVEDEPFIPGGQPPPPGGPVAVEVAATDDLTFVSADVTIRVGDRVRWTNTGTLIHTVTFDPALAADPANVQLPDGVAPFTTQLGAGEGYGHNFTTAGQYKYVCHVHEQAGMKGTVTVTP